MFRGNNAQPVFVHDDDRRHFADRLSDAVARQSCRFHAFCLMPNHVHLAIQEGVPPSKIVQSIAQRHAVPSRRREAAHPPAVAGWITGRLGGALSGGLTAVGKHPTNRVLVGEALGGGWYDFPWRRRWVSTHERTRCRHMQSPGIAGTRCRRSA
jgi:REP element-mobilizing transposase RayT